MRKHHSLELADEVFEHLKPLVNDPNDDVWLECFDNCREQGYIISGIVSINIAFAQYRNSDAIVVYQFEGKFYWPSNTPNDEDSGWEKRVFFKCNEVEEAAKYIAGLVNEKLKKDSVL